jgi:xanthine dehydrogenase YagT iron-sulfur-binding subunit
MRDREKPNEGDSSLSRRAFLQGSGAAVAATAVATAATETVAAETQKPSRLRSAELQNVVLTVNGKKHHLKIEPRVTLLDALRNDLNLTGAKDVGNESNDGADTVIIDGKAVYAGTRLAIEVEGKNITTVEGLSEGKNIDEVISAFVKHDATQCGFCTPGFVVAVRAFLNKYPSANLEQIRKGLGGNLCRCGTYDGVTKAVLELCKKGGA